MGDLFATTSGHLRAPGLTPGQDRRMLLVMRAVVILASALWLGMSGVASAAENARVVTAVAEARVYPNPSHDLVRIAFGPTAPNSIIIESYQLRVTVHNVTGRLVRRLRDGPIGVGDHGEITWDGRTDSGRRVPSGFYYIRIVRNGQVSVVKVWYIR